MSACGKWIIAACVDQRAEAHDFGIWPTQSEAFETHVITQVWNFALQFARKANVEWRIVFAKLGSIGESELHGGAVSFIQLAYYLLIFDFSLGDLPRINSTSLP